MNSRTVSEHAHIQRLLGRVIICIITNFRLFMKLMHESSHDLAYDHNLCYTPHYITKCQVRMSMNLMLNLDQRTREPLGGSLRHTSWRHLHFKQFPVFVHSRIWTM